MGFSTLIIVRRPSSRRRPRFRQAIPQAGGGTTTDRATRTAPRVAVATMSNALLRTARRPAREPGRIARRTAASPRATPRTTQPRFTCWSPPASWPLPRRENEDERPLAKAPRLRPRRHRRRPPPRSAILSHQCCSRRIVVSRSAGEAWRSAASTTLVRHRPRHRPDAAGNGGDPACHLGCAGVDVAVVLVGAGDADVDEHRTGLDVSCGDEPRVPAAAITMSARRRWLARSLVPVWHWVTVAFSLRRVRSSASDRPTVMPRPTRTTSAPSIRMSYARSSSTMPRGVA